MEVERSRREDKGKDSKAKDTGKGWQSQDWGKNAYGGWNSSGWTGRKGEKGHGFGKDIWNGGKEGRAEEERLRREEEVRRQAWVLPQEHAPRRKDRWD